MSESLPTVLNSTFVTEDYLQPLIGIAHIIQSPAPERLMTRDEILEIGSANNAVGIIIPGELQIDTEVLDALTELKIIANTAAGYNNLPLEEMTQRGIWATNTPDAFVNSTAGCRARSPPRRRPENLPRRPLCPHRILAPRRIPPGSLAGDGTARQNHGHHRFRQNRSGRGPARGSFRHVDHLFPPK